MPETDPQIAPSIDSLAQRVQALEDGLRMHRHTGFDLSQKLINASISGASLVNASTLGDGMSTSGTLTLLRAAGRGSVYIRGGTMAAGDFANTSAKKGFIMGEDDVDGKDKFYFGDAVSYIKYDGTTLTVVGSVAVSKLDIPDATTASSFHTDASGNSWWGANVSSGLSNANASITAAGAAVFKNVSIGGAAIQYVITNSGIFSYGDGSDSTATFDGSATPSGSTKSGSNYTLTRDVYYTDMTMSTGTTLNPAGYRVFGTGTLTMNGTATIFRNGNPGTDGSVSGGASTPGGAGGAALADGYLKGAPAGGAGGSSGTGGGGSGAAGTAGTSLANCLGTNGATGGSGDSQGIGSGGGGGAGGTATAANVKLIANWHLATLLDISSSGSTVKFNPSAGAGGGGGGSNGGWPGGGGGSGGGIIAIYFRSIVIGASASITANGGAGGAGHGTGGLGAGLGGGGGGGNGGIIVLTYNQISNSGSITTTGGLGGSAPSPATAGGNGTGGTLYQFQLSL